MSGIAYGFAEMTEQRAELLDVIQQLESRTRQADAAVRRFCSSWQGEAREAFDAEYRRWNTSAAQLMSDLAYLHKLVGLAHGNYASADRAVTGIWGGTA